MMQVLKLRLAQRNRAGAGGYPADGAPTPAAARAPEHGSQRVGRARGGRRAKRRAGRLVRPWRERQAHEAEINEQRAKAAELLRELDEARFELERANAAKEREKAELQDQLERADFQQRFAFLFSGYVSAPFVYEPSLQGRHPWVQLVLAQCTVRTRLFVWWV